MPLYKMLKLKETSCQHDQESKRVHNLKAPNDPKSHGHRRLALDCNLDSQISSTINQESARVPTIVRPYHKINPGPFVETAYGLRLLHKEEVERLMGCKNRSSTSHFKWFAAVEMIRLAADQDWLHKATKEIAKTIGSPLKFWGATICFSLVP